MPPRVDFTLQRLFVDLPMHAGAELALDRTQSNYLVSVLRMRQGDGLLVFNGRDGEWRASLGVADRKAARLTLKEHSREQPASGRITLAFAPIKHARLDYMVQKAVEMGAAHLVPVITHRTQVTRLNTERLSANIIEAAEQCGVLGLPSLAPEQKLGAYLAQLDAHATVIFCDEFADITAPITALQSVARDQDVIVLIGPEGGFDAAERATLQARTGVIRLSLGPRILRADTAAVAALAAVQMALGDWG